jgi:hypothetical protein
LTTASHRRFADVRIDPPAVMTDEIRGARTHDDGSVGMLHWLIKRRGDATHSGV